MSNRYEFVSAPFAAPEWLFPHAADVEDQELLDDVPVGEQAVILGDPSGCAMVITGTVEDLRRVAAQLAALLEQEPPDRPVLEEEPRVCGALVDDGVDDFGVQVMGAEYCEDLIGDCGHTDLDRRASAQG